MDELVVCAGPKVADAFRRSAGRVAVEADPWRLRERMRADLMGATVLVGEAGGLSDAPGFPSAMNVAAAVASDGFASEVALVCDHATDELSARASRAGVSRVLTLDEAVRMASGLSSYRHGVGRREGVPVVVFVSGRGGVGKTTVAALWGATASSWGMRVALLDLDLAFGNLAALLGAEEPQDLASLADDELTVKAVELCGARLSERLGVWGPCRRPERAELVQPHVSDIIAALTQGHDLVLVDTSAAWSDAVAEAAQLADRLVIVSDERPGAIPALARCGELAVRLGVARTRIVRLMNGCDPRRRDESFVARAAVGLECAREVRVMDGGIEAVELLSCGRAAELAGLEGPLSTSLGSGLAQVLRELGQLPECEATRRALEGRRATRGALAALLGRDRT